MNLLNPDNLLEADHRHLCNICQNISFDRFIAERTLRHDVFSDIRRKSSHCVLCRLIFHRVKKSIVDSSVSEIELEGYLTTIAPCEITLSFSMSPENDEWLRINLGPPSIMIDGWLPFGQSNSLRLFCQPGELRFS